MTEFEHQELESIILNNNILVTDIFLHSEIRRIYDQDMSKIYQYCYGGKKKSENDLENSLTNAALTDRIIDEATRKKHDNNLLSLNIIKELVYKNAFTSLVRKLDVPDDSIKSKLVHCFLDKTITNPFNVGSLVHPKYTIELSELSTIRNNLQVYNHDVLKKHITPSQNDFINWIRPIIEKSFMKSDMFNSSEEFAHEVLYQVIIKPMLEDILSSRKVDSIGNTNDDNGFVLENSLRQIYKKIGDLSKHTSIPFILISDEYKLDTGSSYFHGVVENLECEVKKISPGSIIVIAGHTASGKDVVTQRIIEIAKEKGREVVLGLKYKTREKRGYENNLDGHFVTREEFDRLKQEDRIICDIEYKGELYGIDAEINNTLLLGKDVIIHSDIETLERLKEKYNDSIISIHSSMLHCSQSEALKRMKGREEMNQESRNYRERFAGLEQDLKMYNGHVKDFRSLFNTTKSGIDDVANRIIEYISYEESVKGLNIVNFHDDYVSGLIHKLFNKNSVSRLKGSSMKFKKSDRNKVALEYNMEDSEIDKALEGITVSRYHKNNGVLTIFLEGSNIIDQSEKNRNVILELIKNKLGTPKNASYTPNFSPISYNAFTKLGGSMSAHLISYSFIDPISYRKTENIHTLNLEYIHKPLGKEPIVNNLGKDHISKILSTD